MIQKNELKCDYEIKHVTVKYTVCIHVCKMLEHPISSLWLYLHAVQFSSVIQHLICYFYITAMYNSPVWIEVVLK